MSKLTLIPNLLYDPGEQPRGPLDPLAVVWHRTYGGWGGDYSVGKHGGPTKVTGFHWLFGKDKGQAVQFYPINIKCNHAAGANSTTVGVEFTGRNDEPLTENQLYWGAKVIQIMHEEWGVPLDFYDGARRRPQPGFTCHANVDAPAGTAHSDLVTRSDWEAMLHLAYPSGTGDDMPGANDRTGEIDNEFGHWILMGNGAIFTLRGPYCGSIGGLKVKPPDSHYPLLKEKIVDGKVVEGYVIGGNIVEVRDGKAFPHDFSFPAAEEFMKPGEPHI